MYVNDIKKARKTKLVPSDKFDQHMKRARLTDLSSRKKIFSLQSDENELRRDARNGLKTSIY